MSRWIFMIAGELIVWVALLDIFLTVLFTRIGTSLIANRLAGWLWRLFRTVSRVVPRWRDGVLSFAGPVIMVLILSFWTWALNVGTALIVYPNLGEGIRDTSGPTAKSFLTALYAGGISLSVVGASNYSPQTTGFRMFYLFNSVIGTSVLSLMVTYLMQVYNALQTRATLALRAHLSSGETGDAADLVAGLGPEGEFSAGYSRLSEFAAQVSGLRETYDRYPVLLYFRYAEPFYALSRVALLAFDTVSLIKSGLEDRQFRWLKESAAVDELWRGCTRLLVALANTYLPGERWEDRPSGPPDEPAAERWRARYRAALPRFGQAGLATFAEPGAGAEIYVSLRARWDDFVPAFARFMAYEVSAVDPVGCDPSRVRERPAFEERARTAL